MASRGTKSIEGETDRTENRKVGEKSKGAADRAAAGGKALLDIRFNEPQEFIQIAGGRGENIRSILVFGFIDRLAHIVSDDGIAVSQRFQVILNVMDIERVALQRRFAVNDLSGAQCDAAQLARRAPPWCPGARLARYGSHPAFRARR